MKNDIFEDRAENLSRKQSFAEDFVLPDYLKLNVKNILNQIGSVFGIKQNNQSFLPKSYFDDDQDIEKVIFIIFDGLGYDRFLSYLNSHDGTFSELAQKGVLNPITTTFPSTTSTVLASIFTGLTPAQHQILGYHMFSKKYGLIFNTLDMRPVYGYGSQLDLAKDYSRQIKSWLPTLREKGIEQLVVTKASIAGSGLSQIIHKDLRLIPYLLGSDMLTQSIKELEKPEPTLLIMYYSSIDSLEHRYGPNSPEVSFELASIEHNLKNFFSKLSDKVRNQTLLVISADHGVAETRKTIFLKDTKQITSRLMLPPVGDSRATFLFSKHNQQEELITAFKNDIEGFKLFSSNELIELGAFGQTANTEELKEKVGDITAIANAQNAIQYPFFEDERIHPMIGTHGGMTSKEIIVPLLSVKLSRI